MNSFEHSWFAETFKPAFIDKKHGEKGPFEQLLSYRRLYRLSLLFMAWMALGPLTGFAIMEHFVSRQNTEELIQCRLASTAEYTSQAVSFSIEQRKKALSLVASSYYFQQINDTALLSTTLSNMNKVVGGFLDLAVINHLGIQVGHTASHDPNGKDYSREEWFRGVVATGSYLSDISYDSYSDPHFFIAVLQPQDDGTFYILRAALTGRILRDVIEKKSVGTENVLLVNRDGFIQTPSRDYEGVLEKINLPRLSFDSASPLMFRRNGKGESFFQAYVDIPSTPFILVLNKPESVHMKSWNQTRWAVVWFLSFSLLFIAVLVYAMATRLVNEVFFADQQRLKNLREVEHTNKLDSIGRLAAGVGYEINEPLAVINQQAGLIQDIISFKEEYKKDQQLTVLVSSILTTVKRCRTITRRLIDFAGHLDRKIEVVNIQCILECILDLLRKESEFRGFKISLDVSDDIPFFECDRGKLQQVFFNIINNSFAAMEEGGSLNITASYANSEKIVVIISDNGCGIPEEDVGHIFEPFFFSISENVGTGLGLSITHALVQEIGGLIKVTSQLGQGTEFTVEIPLVKGTMSDSMEPLT